MAEILTLKRNYQESADVTDVRAFQFSPFPPSNLASDAAVMAALQ